MIAPSSNAIDCILNALGSTSWGTRFGTIAWRAGRSKETATAWMAVKRYICQTRICPVTVSQARHRATRAIEVWVIAIIARRSNRSATRPAPNENTRIGKKRTTQIPLTTMGWSESARICQSRAHNCICEPATDIIKPAHKYVNWRYFNAGGSWSATDGFRYPNRAGIENHTLPCGWSTWRWVAGCV